MNTPYATPLPAGYVYLGRGGTFKIPDNGTFKGALLVAGLETPAWEISHVVAGNSGAFHYCAPADSEVVRLNQPDNKLEFILWCPARGETHRKHSSLESAETEARRLANKHPGMVFHICQIVASYKGEVTVSKL